MYNEYPIDNFINYFANGGAQENSHFSIFLDNLMTKIKQKNTFFSEDIYDVAGQPLKVTGTKESYPWQFPQSNPFNQYMMSMMNMRANPLLNYNKFQPPQSDHQQSHPERNERREKSGKRKRSKSNSRDDSRKRSYSRDHKKKKSRICIQ